MSQGVLPFQYEEEKRSTGMTALAGLPLYLDLAGVTGLARSIGRHVRLREGARAGAIAPMRHRGAAEPGWWGVCRRHTGTGEGRGVVQGVREGREPPSASEGAQGGREEVA